VGVVAVRVGMVRIADTVRTELVNAPMLVVSLFLRGHHKIRFLTIAKKNYVVDQNLILQMFLKMIHQIVRIQCARDLLPLMIVKLRNKIVWSVKVERWLLLKAM
jgi:hypothetical protein